jgi:uncharacterized protein YeaO (DUF488 family)
MLKLKRAYEAPAKSDGMRILVERLWPRGVSKEAAQIDVWLREISPSTELRKWYGHAPERWPEFQKRYRAELDKLGDVLTLLKYLTQHQTVTFVFAASDEERNSAVVLKAYLEDQAE